LCCNYSEYNRLFSLYLVQCKGFRRPNSVLTWSDSDTASLDAKMSNEINAAVGMAKPQKQSSAAKDLTAGTVGGIAQVLVGQPFDIVKVTRSRHFGHGCNASDAEFFILIV
jgi:hypothetical protein